MKTTFTQKENSALSEIYRRLNYFHDGDLNTNLLTLATPFQVKEIVELGIIKPISKEIPREYNWYNLTEKGKIFFKNYVTKNKLSDNTNHKIFIGDYVKEFDYNLWKNI